jgi:pimeloyl-ACP methyl ester carboxylesterase
MRLGLKIVAAVALLLVMAGAGLVYFHPLWVADTQIRLHLWHSGIRGHYVQAGRYRVHYFEALPPPPSHGGEARPGIPLVLIHGLDSRGEDWSAMIPTLAAHGFHVYAPDLPGYGRSDHPDADYSIAFEAQCVADFMQAVHLTHADVIGWSMGGWVAAKLTLAHPELVDRLGLFDSAGIYFPYTFDSSLFLPTDAHGLARLSAMLSPAPNKIPAFAVRDALDRLQSNRTVVQRSVDQMFSGRDLLDFRLQMIHKPTLIVWGADDRLIPLSAGETMHRDMPQSVLLVVDGCGHLAPGECAKPVLQETIAFLTTNPPQEGFTLNAPKP